TSLTSGGLLLRKLDDLDRPLAGQALKQEVRQAESPSQALRQRPLAQRPALTDGRQDLEIALGLPLDIRRSGTVVVHLLNVQYLNTPGPGLSRKTTPWREKISAKSGSCLVCRVGSRMPARPPD